jgi:hypothetical protein
VQNAKGYDVPMIRDFLEHLLWEVRLNLYENAAKPGAINQELVDKLSVYQGRYGRVTLLATNQIDTGGETKERIRQAVANFREFMRLTREGQIRQLEALQRLFSEAFGCAEMSCRCAPDKWPVRIWTVKRLLGEEGAQAT